MNQAPASVKSPSQIDAFATTSPGLERVLRGELAALGFTGHAGKAGVAFRTDRVGLEQLCVQLATAHRVLWTLGSVDARDGDSLYRSVLGLVRWRGLIPPDRTLAVSATVRDNASLRDHRFVGLRVKDAIVDAVRAADPAGMRPSVDPAAPDVLVRVAIARDRGIVSLDAAGKISLHARGYRQEAGEAPVRETLAAGILKLAGWDGTRPLWDPMCGSGTFVVEAARSARGVAPGLGRADFGFMRWPGFRAARFEAFRAELEAAVRPLPPELAGRIGGSDRDAELLEVARRNAERAGVGGDVRWALADAREVQAPGAGVPGLLVTNPPWGVRMHGGWGVIAEVAAHWKAAFSGWQAAVLVPDGEAARALNLRGAREVVVEAGGRDVLVALGTL